MKTKNEAMVRFTTTCDHCGKRAEEYSAWPSCRGCLADTCHSCAAPGSLRTGDGEGPDTNKCKTCDVTGAEDEFHTRKGEADMHGMERDDDWKHWEKGDNLNLRCPQCKHAYSASGTLRWSEPPRFCSSNCEDDYELEHPKYRRESKLREYPEQCDTCDAGMKNGKCERCELTVKGCDCCPHCDAGSIQGRSEAEPWGKCSECGKEGRTPGAGFGYGAKSGKFEEVGVFNQDNVRELLGELDAMPDSFFRKLNPEEEVEFRMWARTNYKTLDRTKVGMYHPVVRDEIKRLDKQFGTGNTEVGEAVDKNWAPFYGKGGANCAVCSKADSKKCRGCGRAYCGDHLSSHQTSSPCGRLMNGGPKCDNGDSCRECHECGGATEKAHFCSRFCAAQQGYRQKGGKFVRESVDEGAHRCKQVPFQDAGGGKSIGVECCNCSFRTPEEAEAHEKQHSPETHDSEYWQELPPGVGLTKKNEASGCPYCPHSLKLHGAPGEHNGKCSYQNPNGAAHGCHCLGPSGSVVPDQEHLLGTHGWKDGKAWRHDYKTNKKVWESDERLSNDAQAVCDAPLCTKRAVWKKENGAHLCASCNEKHYGDRDTAFAYGGVEPKSKNESEEHPKIAKLRQIAAGGPYQKAKVDGMPLSHMHAQAMVAVHDALNDENKAKFTNMRARAMWNVTQKLMDKGVVGYKIGKGEAFTTDNAFDLLLEVEDNDPHHSYLDKLFGDKCTYPGCDRPKKRQEYYCGAPHGQDWYDDEKTRATAQRWFQKGEARNRDWNSKKDSFKKKPLPKGKSAVYTHDWAGDDMVKALNWKTPVDGTKQKKVTGKKWKGTKVNEADKWATTQHGTCAHMDKDCQVHPMGRCDRDAAEGSKLCRKCKALSMSRAIHAFKQGH